MSRRQHTIELNGQKYDAVTGKIIATSAATHPSAVTAKPTPQPTKKAIAKAPKHLDGFTRRPGVAKATKTRPSAAPTHAVHHKTAKSQTLMRKAVTQPISTKIHAKIVPKHAVLEVPPVEVTTNSGLFGGMQPGRALRASHISKNSLVSRFGTSKATIQTAAIAVKPAPATAKTTAHSPAAPATSRTHKSSTNQFHAAIDNATSHEQPRARKQRYHHKVARKLRVSPRLVNFAGMAMVVLGISGFFAYQNLPELSMRVAAARSGLDASLPAYQPAGFKIAGPIEYEPGAVTLNYKSSTDERSFNVTQKNSSWNSETLLESYVSPTKEPYQTFQANGRTIYIYEGNKATWVDGGVWYNINGKANLNSDQLLRIAESL